MAESSYRKAEKFVARSGLELLFKREENGAYSLDLHFCRLGVRLPSMGDTPAAAILNLQERLRILERDGSLKWKMSPASLANMTRANDARRAKTHCSRGHVLPARREGKQRRCLSCQAAAQRRYLDRKKNARREAREGVA